MKSSTKNTAMPLPDHETLSAVVKRYAQLDMFAAYAITAPDSPGPDGDTPFHMAAFDGDIEAARIMLPVVSNINLKGDNGFSPLHYAAMRGKFEMVRFLVQMGADPDQPDDYGDTPADYMSRLSPIDGA